MPGLVKIIASFMMSSALMADDAFAADVRRAAAWRSLQGYWTVASLMIL
jgi:hypothetical protein